MVSAEQMGFEQYLILDVCLRCHCVVLHRKQLEGFVDLQVCAGR